MKSEPSIKIRLLKGVDDLSSGSGLEDSLSAWSFSIACGFASAIALLANPATVWTCIVFLWGKIIGLPILIAILGGFAYIFVVPVIVLAIPLLSWLFAYYVSLLMASLVIDLNTQKVKKKFVGQPFTRNNSLFAIYAIDQTSYTDRWTISIMEYSGGRQAAYFFSYEVQCPVDIRRARLAIFNELNTQHHLVAQVGDQGRFLRRVISAINTADKKWTELVHTKERLQDVLNETSRVLGMKRDNQLLEPVITRAKSLVPKIENDIKRLTEEISQIIAKRTAILDYVSVPCELRGGGDVAETEVLISLVQASSDHQLNELIEESMLLEEAYKQIGRSSFGT